MKGMLKSIIGHRSGCFREFAGIARALIALWLDHEFVETTQIYLDADLTLKEKVLAKTTPIKGTRALYRASDELLAFLKSL